MGATKRRVNPLTRERARARMLAMPVEERKARARKMVEARRAKRARRPERLDEVERRMDALGGEYRDLPAYPDGQQRRREIRRELRDLGEERMRLIAP